MAEFPTHLDQIAILLDCDNVEGDTLTWLDNRGRLRARGGAANGNGGDVMFHGITPDGEEPVPGRHRQRRRRHRQRGRLRIRMSGPPGATF